MIFHFIVFRDSPVRFFAAFMLMFSFFIYFFILFQAPLRVSFAPFIVHKWSYWESFAQAFSFENAY